MKETDAELASQTQRVLDFGYVRLDGALADDLSVVNSARVSFNKHAEEMGPSEKGLIRFLMKNHHGTPFEHNVFRFEVKAPIFVVREWMRHRIGSFNELSGRYAEMEKEFYIPSLKNIRTQVGKPGAYTFETVDEESAKLFQQEVRMNSQAAWTVYEDCLAGEMIEGKKGMPIAKELARLVLPVNLYTKFFWSVNARSLMNFVALRNESQAMYEIQQFASAVENMFEWKMPVTYAAFVDAGRVSP